MSFASVTGAESCAGAGALAVGAAGRLVAAAVAVASTWRSQGSARQRRNSRAASSYDVGPGRPVVSWASAKAARAMWLGAVDYAAITVQLVHLSPRRRLSWLVK